MFGLILDKGDMKIATLEPNFNYDAPWVTRKMLLHETPEHVCWTVSPTCTRQLTCRSDWIPF